MSLIGRNWDYKFICRNAMTTHCADIQENL